MGRPAAKVTDGELAVAWDSGEPFKAVAARIGMSPNTLRGRWKGLYGETAFTERGRRLQAAAAAATMRATAATRTYRDVGVPCSACGMEVVLKANQTAHLDTASFRCERCSGDRDCPVCGQRVDGERGMSGHFRHRREAGDKMHPAYERGEADALWIGRVEPLDYVTCRECGLRSSNLSGHIRVHGVTAEEYHLRYAGARVRSDREQSVLNRGTAQSHVDGKHLGLKTVTCPDCDAEWDAPKSLALSVHDLRCAVCQALGDIAEDAARWEGKSEPEDFVTCRVCGVYRGENLTSHFQSAHPDVVGRYAVRFPRALVMSAGAPQRVASNKLNLTRDDLVPFMDNQGRVEVAKAAAHFHCVHWTVLRACRRLALPTRNRLAFQKRVLDAVSEVLGGDGYIWEWSHTEIRNPKTGYLLYFDGLFAKQGLIVEAHGVQHFKYIPYWHQSEGEFEARKELDVLKVREAESRGYRVLVIRHDEPFTNPAYLAGRLVQMGLRVPKVDVSDQRT